MQRSETKEDKVTRQIGKTEKQNETDEIVKSKLPERKTHTVKYLKAGVFSDLGLIGRKAPLSEGEMGLLKKAVTRAVKCSKCRREENESGKNVRQTVTRTLKKELKQLA
ncbi:hypothetical protein AMECASPLE_002583 [Ameca splendens]|uniref:Uncharacterized protein n=1 Tax=Ameca splendens TaxID=208324 RepID=A0ABV1A6S6_9TELE